MSGTPTFTDLSNQTAYRLQQINGNFVQQELQGPFTGAPANPSSSDDSKKILGILTSDYSAANAGVLVSRNISPAAFSYKSTAADGSWTPFTTANAAEAASVVNQPSSGTDVNVWKIATASSLTGAGKTFLNRLRILYSFLDETTYTAFLAGHADQVTLDPTYADSTKTFTTANSPQDVLDYLSSIGVTKLVDVSKLDSKRTNLVVLRRLCVLYEMLFYLHASTYILDSISEDTGTQAANQKSATNASNLIQSLLSTLQKLNTNLNDNSGSDSENSIASLQQRMQQRSAAYNQNLNSIQKLDGQIKDLKVFLQGEMERLNSENETQVKTRPFEYVAMAFFGVVAVAAVVILVTPMPRPHQLTGAVVLFAVAIFVAGLFKFLFLKRVEEGFDAPTLPKPDYAMYGINTKARADMKTSVQRAIYEAANEYLSNTIFLGLILQAYRTYGIAGYSLQKEVNYYSDKYAQMGTTRYKLRQTASVVSLEQRVQTARLNLFVALMLIVAGTTLALIASSSMPALTNYIYGVAGFLILLTVFVFLFEITYRVRTDGDKYYWGRPNTSNL